MYRIMYCGWFPLFSWIYCGHGFESGTFFEWSFHCCSHIFCLSFTLVLILFGHFDYHDPKYCSICTNTYEKKSFFLVDCFTIVLQLCDSSCLIWQTGVIHSVTLCTTNFFFVLLTIVYGIWGAKQKIKTEPNRRNHTTNAIGKVQNWLSFMRYSFGMV